MRLRFAWACAWACLGICACTRTAGGSALEQGSSESGSSASDTSETDTSETDTDETGETGETPVSCSSEWDCGVGERCVEGICACVGCDCDQPAPAPDPEVEADEPDSVPVFLDFVRPECIEDADCEPNEYCSGNECVETIVCADDLDCRAGQGDTSFCIDGLCRPHGCDDEAVDPGCPAGSYCTLYQCQWLQTPGPCVEPPAFELVEALGPIDIELATVVVLDLDLDGRDDLAVLEAGALDWIRSAGASFDAPVAWTGEPGAQRIAIARGDIHGDGDGEGDGFDELLVSRADAPGVEILVATPDGPELLALAETASIPEAAITLDVDYDGLPDLVTGTIVGSVHRVQAQLGDGSGNFGPLWEDEAEPFEFGPPYPAYDQPDQCRRAMASVEPELEIFGGRQFQPHRVAGGVYILFNHLPAGWMVFSAGETRDMGHVVSYADASFGLLHTRSTDIHHYVELPLGPGAVALAGLRGPVAVQHVVIDYGVAPGQFVELTGPELAPSCRGELPFALDSIRLQVGDFDGDGREDVLGHGRDGILRVWLSRS